MIMLLLASIFISQSVIAAEISIRYGNIKNSILDYKDNPASFPYCSKNLDYVQINDQANLISLFKTRKVILELGAYGVGDKLTGKEVVDAIRKYEKVGMTVTGMFAYNETWMTTDIGGPYAVDRRIFSTAEINEIRDAIANASPAVKCKDTFKFIQLIGGRIQNQKGDSWLRFSNDLKTHMLKFDGVGIETHINDHLYTPEIRQPKVPTLQAMADLTKWNLDNNKTPLVFVGGAPATYKDNGPVILTLQRLWAEMQAKGVNYKSNKIVYHRQGARSGNHVPESASNTLSYQMKWLMEAIGDDTPSISAIVKQTINANTMGTAEFTIGKDLTPDSTSFSITATSSNKGLLPDSAITISGSGEKRSIKFKPTSNKTGTTVVTISSKTKLYPSDLSNVTHLTAQQLCTLVVIDENEIANKAPIVTILKPTITNGVVNVDQGNELYVNADVVDENLEKTELFIDGKLLRQELVAPYEWGNFEGTNNANELDTLSNGSYTIKVVATDKDGLTGEASFTLNVQAEAPTILHSVGKVSNLNIIAGAGGFRVTTGASPAELKVTNIRGQVVFSESGVFINHFVPMKANGVYFIELSQGNKRLTQKYVAVHN